MRRRLLFFQNRGRASPVSRFCYPCWTILRLRKIRACEQVHQLFQLLSCTYVLFMLRKYMHTILVICCFVISVYTDQIFIGLKNVKPEVKEV